MSMVNEKRVAELEATVQRLQQTLSDLSTALAAARQEGDALRSLLGTTRGELEELRQYVERKFSVLSQKHDTLKGVVREQLAQLNEKARSCPSQASQMAPFFIETEEKDGRVYVTSLGLAQASIQEADLGLAQALNIEPGDVQEARLTPVDDTITQLQGQATRLDGQVSLRPLERTLALASYATSCPITLSEFRAAAYPEEGQSLIEAYVDFRWAYARSMLEQERQHSLGEQA